MTLLTIRQKLRLRFVRIVYRNRTIRQTFDCFLRNDERFYENIRTYISQIKPLSVQNSKNVKINNYNTQQLNIQKYKFLLRSLCRIFLKKRFNGHVFPSCTFAKMYDFEKSYLLLHSSITFPLKNEQTKTGRKRRQHNRRESWVFLTTLRNKRQ